MNASRFREIELFLLGFATLFLELALIRYLAGNIWNMGYFPNLVLMSVFIGMGIGFVFHARFAGTRSVRAFYFAPLLLLLLFVIIFAARPTVPGFDSWLGNIGGEVFYTSLPRDTSFVDYFLFLLTFFFIVAVFACISQRTAALFTVFTPLKAYTLDILGSCAGIVAFMLCSWLRLPAFVWFAALIPLFWLIQASDPRSIRLRTAVVLLVIVGVAQAQDTRLFDTMHVRDVEVQWSPYQKVAYAPNGTIFVNGIGHQVIRTPETMKVAYYHIPYQYRAAMEEPPYEDVLVIGAGSGNDVAAALQHGVRHVDAVEIDPTIADLGRRHHPLEPYADPRVNQVVDDARAFMTYTTHRYDLIIFALTDSLVKVSPMAQLRLENYIFTEQSVARAARLLKPGGHILFYNYYRTPWVRDKILLIAKSATGLYPRIIHQTDRFTMMVVDAAHPGAVPSIEADLEMATDDWPFPYLKRREIPAIYRSAMLAVAVFILVLAFALRQTGRRKRPDGEPSPAGPGLALELAFALMGAAFLLLETKSVIQFSLLFGTTWINNSLVFLSVLVFVLLANATARALRNTPGVLASAFVLLCGFCVAAYLYPLSHLLAVQSVAMRFAAAAVLTFSPIYFANVIFSVTFRDAAVPEHLFGWNLIGAACGGLFEYTSMALGYNALALIVAGCYAVVYLLIRLAPQVPARLGAREPAAAPATLG